MRRFLLSLAVVVGAAPAFGQGVDFTIDYRRDTDVASVPVVRAVRPNTPTALDVVPNGNPKSVGTLGAAWIHVCNNDLHVGQLNCALVGAADEAVRFGSSNYLGATPKRIEWVIGNKVVGYLDADRMVLGAFNSARAAKQIADLRAQNRRLAREVRAMRVQVRKMNRAVKALAARD